MGLFDTIMDDWLGFDPPSMNQASLLTGNQQALEKMLSGLAQQGIGEPGAVYPGQWVPGETGLQSQAFSQAPGGLSQANQMFNDLIGRATTGVSFDPIRANAINSFNTEFMPNFLATYGNETSANSGIAQRNLARTRRDLELGLAAQEAQFANQGANRNLQAAGMAGMPLDYLAQGANLGSMQRQIQGQQMDAERQRFDMMDPTRSPAAALGLSLLGGQYTQPYQQQSAASSMLPGIGSFLGGAGNVGAMAGNLGSLAGGIGSAAGMLGGAASGIGGAAMGLLGLI